MKLSNDWAPARMVEQLSANLKVGDGGLKVSASTLVLVLGITDEARANFVERQKLPVKPEHKYLFYREHPDGYISNPRNGEPCPMLWGVRFGFFDYWARHGCPAWWGVYDDEHPLNAKSELLPDGVRLEEVCALSQ